MRMFGISLALVAPLLSLALGGCDKAALAASASADLAERAQPAFQEFWDYELAGEAIPGNIIQLEVLLRVEPEDERILLHTVQIYGAYAFGWIEDRAEALEVAGDHLAAGRQRRRARYFYQRALDLALFRLELRHPGYRAAHEAGVPALEAWLASEFQDPADAEDLFWVGYPLASMINVARDDLSLVTELPVALAFLERSAALDEDYFGGAALMGLAAAATATPGADLDEAEERWNRVLEVTERHNLVALVQMARLYAVRRHDRALYVSLLREVLEAGDVSREARLQNAIARVRAERDLRLVDERFPE